jgi:hypothetical protein
VKPLRTAPNERALKITDAASPERMAFRSALVKEPKRFRYVREKLYQAVDALIGDGDLGIRLAHANLCLSQLTAYESTVPEFVVLLKPILLALQPNLDDPTAKVRINPVGLRSLGDKLARRIFELHIEAMGGLR